MGLEGGVGLEVGEAVGAGEAEDSKRFNGHNNFNTRLDYFRLPSVPLSGSPDALMLMRRSLHHP